MIYLSIDLQAILSAVLRFVFNIINFYSMKKFIFKTLLIFSIMTGKSYSQNIESRDDFKKYYDQYKVEGTFVLYDQNNDKYVCYNQIEKDEPFIPASTFKIMNSLIGLETGVISDENFVIPWDSVIRQVENWNKDHDMKTAFKNSTVWYYQELARRVGGKQMKYWLNIANYGNADTSGGIDKFWLTGGLRISPVQQTGFLKRLHDNTLPFSQRSMDIVKKIMIAEETPDYTVRGKTGWSSMNNLDIGWYVGYLETKDNVYYFANCIQTADADNSGFAQARKEIAYQILNDMDLITGKDLKISHLTGGFYIFTTYKDFNGQPFPSNGMYLVTDDGVLMFDTPWDTAQCQPLLDYIENHHNKKVVFCISTHYHDDRTAGLDFLKSKGVKTFSSKQTYDLCRESNNDQAEFYFIGDTTFVFGDHSFQTFYPGEGHTKDNIVLWFDNEKILYGGCLVKSTENSNLGNIADANINEWPVTVNNVIKKFHDPVSVIPGHFGWDNNQGLQHTLELLKQNDK